MSTIVQFRNYLKLGSGISHKTQLMNRGFWRCHAKHSVGPTIFDLQPVTIGDTTHHRPPQAHQPAGCVIKRSGFIRIILQTDKIGNTVIIADFVFLYICSLLLYFDITNANFKMQVDVKGLHFNVVDLLV